jgi:hypothetical protein
VVLGVKVQIADIKAYLDDVKLELQKTWSENRAVKFDCAMVAYP